ncbi:flavodoxin family protein [Candidatus Omnitrophota bacterium]
MLRKIGILLIIVTFFVLGNSIWAENDNKILVVYYSRTGHTQLVAEKLAERFDADIERLIDKRKRTGPIGYARASKDAVAKNLTDLAPLTLDPSQYDVVLIGTPSWYGNMTPAVRTFLNKNDISGKVVAVFGTAHLTGVENACKQVAEAVLEEDFEKMPTLALRERDLKDEVLSEKIETFYESVMVYMEAQHQNTP